MSNLSFLIILVILELQKEGGMSATLIFKNIIVLYVIIPSKMEVSTVKMPNNHNYVVLKC